MVKIIKSDDDDEDNGEDENENDIDENDNDNEEEDKKEEKNGIKDNKEIKKEFINGQEGEDIDTSSKPEENE